LLSAAAGGDASDATLLVNPSAASQGRLGLALALPAGRTFAAGAHQLALLTFAPAEGAAGSPLALGFGDEPTAREIADVAAQRRAASYESEVGKLANVSAASFRKGPLAPAQIVAAFGAQLAFTAASAATQLLPAELAGTRVVVTDSQGIARAAPLYSVAPNQVNYQLPPETAVGPATVAITNANGTISTGLIEVAPVAPGLFATNDGGLSVAAAVLLRVRADGSRQYEPVARFDAAQNGFVTVPIDLGPASDQVFLIVFGTGLRRLSAPGAAQVSIGGVNSEALYAGAQGEQVGLDQVNARLSRSLMGRGEVDLVVTVDGRATNTVRINLK
jgi:uncharacterized protein (TIGR03437 family)